MMAEHGAFLVPTLVTYDAMERRGAELGLAPGARAKNREVLPRAHPFRPRQRPATAGTTHLVAPVRGPVTTGVAMS